VCSGHRPFSEPGPEHSGAAAKPWCRCARVDWVDRVRRLRHGWYACLPQVCDREPQGRDRHDDVGASSAWHAGARSIGVGHHRPALQRRTCLVAQNMRRAGGRMQSRWPSCSCSLAGRWRMARCTTAWMRATATPIVGLTRPRGRGRCPPLPTCTMHHKVVVEPPPPPSPFPPSPLPLPPPPSSHPPGATSSRARALSRSALQLGVVRRAAAIAFVAFVELRGRSVGRSVSPVGGRRPSRLRRPLLRDVASHSGRRRVLFATTVRRAPCRTSCACRRRSSCFCALATSCSCAAARACKPGGPERCLRPCIPCDMQAVAVLSRLSKLHWPKCAARSVALVYRLQCCARMRA
jgi:hypothetical protein